MSRALILQNVTREGPGLLLDVLKAKGIRPEIVNLDAAEPLPKPEGYDLLIVLGGPDSANDATEKILSELRFIREWLAAGKPYFGICLGLQLLVKAAGGRVVKAKSKELGFLDPDGKPYEIELTAEGRRDLLFHALPERFPVFQLHGETVELAHGMTLLASGRHCENQVVRCGANAYGIQCHVEVTGELLEVWTREDDDLRRMDGRAILAHYASIRGAYKAAGETLLGNFLDGVLTAGKGKK